MMKLTDEQLAFFDTYGFIKFAGLLKAENSWITEEFEAVFPMLEEKHDGSKRTMIVPFADQRERLCSLIDDPRIAGIAKSLLGEDFNYMGSDGNYYTGDTPWHRDGENRARRHIKMALYLDELDGSSGALRVMPGTHRLDDQYGQDAAKICRSIGKLAIHGADLPAQILDVVPGDVLVFDHNLFHASFGGSAQRRMFTLNLCQRFKDEEIDELRSYILMHGHFRRDHYYGQAMLSSATEERRVHLEQVDSVCGDYAERTEHLPRLPMRIGMP
ncbi:phytanoyl-CoA dioxygenase family protein [Paenibacillus sp. CF384]|uniref:phytanoyl-CoA dioxygenase family protein n=1 Tax=Paenibacillus sp. CF384 TaxID=1884382 RepID=UPI000896ABFF|nr:phytanoyl-CoA dioxygenase family protein [Paenibacillus sp. CF384]SDX62583.1 Phytanoyl-CoA dioxygenase (PhyH) [Paenibacillus sp. CF384]